MPNMFSMMPTMDAISVNFPLFRTAGIGQADPGASRQHPTASIVAHKLSIATHHFAPNLARGLPATGRRRV
jgi:hypothetical protein